MSRTEIIQQKSHETHETGFNVEVEDSLRVLQSFNKSKYREEKEKPKIK